MAVVYQQIERARGTVSVGTLRHDLRAEICGHVRFAADTKAGITADL
jgi:hypothetical protein